MLSEGCVGSSSPRPGAPSTVSSGSSRLRGSPSVSDLALRHLQARRGAIPALLPDVVRPPLRGTALRQSLRSPPGSARRDRGRRHLLRKLRPWARIDHQRNRGADPRLRLRLRRGRCPGKRPRPRRRRALRAYNVGTGIETSVNELYEILRQISGRDLPPTRGAAKPGEQLRSSANPTAARVLGWRPETDLASGLKRTLSYFEAVSN